MKDNFCKRYLCKEVNAIKNKEIKKKFYEINNIKTRLEQMRSKQMRSKQMRSKNNARRLKIPITHLECVRKRKN